ncbi:MAG: hypothetical protein ACQEQI_09125, partial [Bacillota bacterium]
MKQVLVPKLEGDYSDILLARGLAEIYKFVLEENDADKPKVIIKDQGGFYLVESNREIKRKYFNGLQFETLYPLIFYDKMDNKPEYTSDIVDFTEDIEYKEWGVNKRKSSLIRQTTGIPLSNKIMDDLYKIKEYFGEILFVIVDFYSELQKDYSLLADRLDQLFDEIQINKFKEIIKNKLTAQELSQVEEELDELFDEFDNYHWSKRNKVKKFIKQNLTQSETTEEIVDNIKELYNQGKIDFTDNHNALSCLLPIRVKGLNAEDLSSDSRITPSNSSENWVKLFLIMIGFYEDFILKS